MLHMDQWEDRLADDGKPVFSIGVVAELLDLPVQSVRRYDDESVVSPSRTDGGQRRYSRNDVVRLARARDLADDGITTTGIRRILDLEDRLDAAEAEISRLRGRLDEPEERS